MSTTESSCTSLYAGVGRVLTHYDVQLDTATLDKKASLTLPHKVQYVWPHPVLPYLYAACSNGSPDARGDAHCVVVLRRDVATGTLEVCGAPVALPARPIHTTIDKTGEHLLTAYNKPSSLTVHRIEAGGAIGPVVARVAEPDAGIYAHQVRVMPSGRSVVIVARGNLPTDSKPEDPGAFKIFSYTDGQLRAKATVAPNGGYGFGPRHIDFHPEQPWIYASLESQNLLHMYKAPDDTVEPLPSYIKETLEDVERGRTRKRQRSGTIHVHPNGRFVYVANRASGTREVAGQPLYIGGENNIAVYQIDPRSGEPLAIQHADTHGIVPRTFALDKTGRVLVAANSVSILAQDGARVVTIPPNLALFRVGDDGRLEYVRKYDIEAGEETLFWMGIVS